MDLLATLAAQARKKQVSIVFPEGEDPVIQEAAISLSREKLAVPILLGRKETILEGLAGRAELQVIDPGKSQLLASYTEAYCREREMPEAVGRRLMGQPLFFGAMMVKAGDAGGMVAGISHPTEEVIMASELIIGLVPGISLASSFFVMQLDGFAAGEEGMLIFADPAVNPDPDPEQLADIAVTTAQSARDLLGWEPRVAMLSFSTSGSASHAAVDKVVQATKIAREKAPEFEIEGEMQVDSALVPEVAAKKIGPDTRVGGKANVLIFPDLNSGNISSKLVQRMAGAIGFGPVLQGFSKPVSDLSRGAGAKDILGASLMVAARAEQ